MYAYKCDIVSRVKQMILRVKALLLPVKHLTLRVKPTVLRVKNNVLKYSSIFVLRVKLLTLRVKRLVCYTTSLTLVAFLSLKSHRTLFIRLHVLLLKDSIYTCYFKLK